jgi:hypothetical protein
MPPTIADHLSHIDTIFDSYEPRSGDDPLAFITDLLVDAALWCMANGTDFAVALRRGQAHATYEWGEAAGRTASPSAIPTH